VGEQLILDPSAASDAQLVASMTMEQRIARAVELLREHEPDDGYYLAFSGGKDSLVIDALARMAGVRYEKRYNNVTIDPPELVRFIKRAHPDAQWNQPPLGNMFHAVAEGPHGVAPPTRFSRWCCRDYKECGGKGRSRIFGVRAEESKGRERRWREVAEALDGFPAICPIVYWTTEQVWEFIRARAIPYCELYDEGWERLGCVGCPLKNTAAREADFRRWPRYADRWRWAVTANWQKWREIPRKDGSPRFHARFATAEEFWHWWMTDERPDVMRECQSGLLWTNEPDGS
jgi:phosphoadenosine phosphosulfate reductase